ncbi:hypothetical protein [Planctomicrobium piriforme]|uniref:Uncharacterized protein n=1 Tax=Planctomicrobium piriforme TaxID=1576369 RepID=A0A1I3BFK5_9PLAN|nr:hypothetical protein [Planctomicrobium piriforme]SFH61063.1 hypothetical protein SAMN05421753_101428 [Planctomicrobium piriforme]
MRRRTFLQTAACGLAGAVLSKNLKADEFPPIRAITQGPHYHWFGYYDKFEFDATNRYVLSNQVDFEHRSPVPGDVINVGMVDLQDGDRWIELGQSNAWGWQQGCMLQWRPGSKSEVIWNDREGDQFVCRTLDVSTGAKRTIPSTVYTLSPDGSFGLTPDFSRIQTMRPGYGYAGLPDRYGDELAPKDSGVFHVDMATGQQKLLLSLHELAQIPYRGAKLENVWQWFNHLLISPDSQRFIVLHRWKKRDPATGGPTGNFATRMITASVNGGDVFVLDPSGETSHFVWRDPEHVCMWTKPEGKPAGFYLFKDRTDEVTPVGPRLMTQNGHNTYLPEHPDWILNDTYPDKTRLQHPYLYNLKTDRRMELGAFYSPPQYNGEWRCDNHPRASRDGRMVVIDSPHGGNGRQLYLIDVSKIIES